MKEKKAWIKGSQRVDLKHGQLGGGSVGRVTSGWACRKGDQGVGLGGQLGDGAVGSVAKGWSCSWGVEL